MQNFLGGFLGGSFFHTHSPRTSRQKDCKPCASGGQLFLFLFLCQKPFLLWTSSLGFPGHRLRRAQGRHPPSLSCHRHPSSLLLGILLSPNSCSQGDVSPYYTSPSKQTHRFFFRVLLSITRPDSQPNINNTPEELTGIPGSYKLARL